MKSYNKKTRRFVTMMKNKTEFSRILDAFACGIPRNMVNGCCIQECGEGETQYDTSVPVRNIVQLNSFEKQSAENLICYMA